MRALLLAAAAAVAGLVVAWIFTLPLIAVGGWSVRGHPWLGILLFHAAMAAPPVLGGVAVGLLLRSGRRSLALAIVAAVLFGALLAWRYFAWDPRMSLEGILSQVLGMVAAPLAVLPAAGFPRFSSRSSRERISRLLRRPVLGPGRRR